MGRFACIVWIQYNREGMTDSDLYNCMGLLKNSQIIGHESGAMHFTQYTDVGIGTDAPDSLLHLYKGTGSGQSTVLKIESDGTTDNLARAELISNGSVQAIDNMTALIRFYHDGKEYCYMGLKPMDFTTASEDAELYIQTMTNGTLTTKMTIGSGGNVGIGKSNPGSKLSVSGLPTSSTGLSSGDIWIDTTAGNVLKIIP